MFVQGAGQDTLAQFFYFLHAPISGIRVVFHSDKNLCDGLCAQKAHTK